MNLKEIYVFDLHYDHKIWENELNFYKNELGIFETRLEDMVKRDMPKEMYRELERFQNKFIRQKEVVDNLKNQIHKYDDALRGLKDTKRMDKDSNHVKFHKKLEDDFRINRKLYFETREDFNKYLERWL
jgi:hypothetical protein